jgi:DNA-binding XRE family transcriptional regulator
MAVNRKGTDYEQFEAELLNNQEIRREYEALNPKYEIIRRLIMQRNKLRMSQAQLARKVGVKQPAICRFETGNSNATLNTFIKVASALDLSIELRAMNTNRKAKKASRRVARV